ncbi:MAG: PAS domain S-box/diguanylate cyclase (GGDEF) domain [Marinobacter excellens HL-55]|uniref:PAS domain S-box/diguanylate cyclase (GGDEF) domain n=1 Tax=Marinobacter excellens HL-55 TaxID=1305731 RepID=A0A0P8B5Y5_9GAMM|nr:MAG: PAS domain S-box/diguanylate cyclase (GGDEF) domain [Marinobacter excellens HL-55]
MSFRSFAYSLVLFSAIAGAWSSTVQAAQGVTLGIFAYRPEPVIQQRYAPLADYLSHESGLPVRLLVLNQEDMNRALATNQIDFFLTNPSHFLVIRSDRSLTGVLATLERDWQGQSTGSIGGVILTRAGRDDINRLEDVRGKSIATPGMHFLGGYQAPALELMDAGVDILRHNRVVHLNSHDRVIRAVQTGDTDIGFIRTGVLEELLLGSPDLMAGLKVVNQQQLSGYPFVVSTRLYPEWPFVSLPHVDSRVVRRIASALFALEQDHPAAKAAYIRGFSPPADYQSVETLARTLRMAPYDQVPRVTWLDVLNQYRVWGITVVLLFISLMITSLWLSRQRRQLAIEERRLRGLIASWPQPMLMIRDAALVECNRAAVELVSYTSEASLLGKGLQAFSPHSQPDGTSSLQKMDTLIRRVGAGEVAQCEWLLVRSDGSEVWVDMTLAPVYEKGQEAPSILCSWYDINRRKHAEERQRLALRVFEHAREAIFITDAHGVVMDINEAYTRITGREHRSAVGSLPPLPLDEGSAILIAARKHGVWAGEFASRHWDGHATMLSLTLSSVFDDHGGLSHFVGTFTDITQLKETEKQLRTLAHFDALTGLPNRVLFSDRLHQSMAQARRQAYQLAVIYIDLDHFKPVNDAFGHDAGDGLLIELARRMRATLREEDTLARLGGDEFAVIVVNVADEPTLQALLSRLLITVSESVWVADHSVEVSASLGYTLYPQDIEMDGDQLLRQADQAMYHAKRDGKNRYCKFSDSGT